MAGTVVGSSSHAYVYVLLGNGGHFYFGAIDIEFFTVSAFIPLCRCVRTFLPKLHATCKMDFEQLSLADGVKVGKEHKTAYIL